MMNITDAVLTSTLKELIEDEIILSSLMMKSLQEWSIVLQIKANPLCLLCKVFANGLALTTERTVN